MFAFGIWDYRDQTFWLVRDHVGVKPLYYTTSGRELSFASEASALANAPAELDNEALDLFLRFRYVPPPLNLYRGVNSLPPGHQIVWKDGTITVTPYWEPQWGKQVVHDVREAEERFASLLCESVSLQLLSDVPLGLFLSGGVDSGLIAGIAAEQTSEPLHAFTVSFEGEHDEFDEAKRMADIFGLTMNRISCGPDCFSRLSEVVSKMHMPIGDAVIVPTFQLSAIAGKTVKTVLTGEGADELLAGYAHQRQLAQIASFANIFAVPGLAALMALGVKVLPTSFWDRFFSYGESLGKVGVERILVMLANIRTEVGRYLSYVELFDAKERKALYKGPMSSLSEQPVPAAFHSAFYGSDNPLRSLVRQEFETWLPGNILMKQDALTMANSLEGRVPYLDHRLVEEVLSWDDQVFKALTRSKRVLHSMLAARGGGGHPRKKRPFLFSTSGPYYTAVKKAIKRHLLDEELAIGHLIDRERIAALYSSLEESPFVRGKQLVALLVLELWVRSRNVC